MAYPIGLLADWVIFGSGVTGFWKRRWSFHVLPALVAFATFAIYAPSLGTGEIGFAMENLPWYRYLAAESEVLLHYGGLVFWPSQLTFDYDWLPSQSTIQSGLACLVMLGVLVGVGIGCYFRRLEAWWLATGLLILAPTSSVIPVKDIAFEHRMYLPSACVLAAVVFWVARLTRDWKLRRVKASGDGKSTLGSVDVAWAGFALLIFAALASRTFLRAQDYSSAYRLWRSTAWAAPHNSRALQNWTEAAEESGQSESLFVELKALHRANRGSRLVSGVVASRLGEECLKKGDNQRAAFYLREALSSLPSARLRSSREELAAACVNASLLPNISSDQVEPLLRRSVELVPDQSLVFAMLGQVALDRGDVRSATRAFEDAVRLDPIVAAYRVDLIKSLMLQGKIELAEQHKQSLLRLMDEEQQNEFEDEFENWCRAAVGRINKVSGLDGAS
ncbi:tetratricopeptide repeat protein [Neorhodopirellula lusitana]|uniref:tetratricopeptide repeat protein n=1 Tax=Neorhodopirellula lusitana TaxID=445327 RepID=UPI00384FF3DF